MPEGSELQAEGDAVVEVVEFEVGDVAEVVEGVEGGGADGEVGAEGEVEAELELEVEVAPAGVVAVVEVVDEGGDAGFEEAVLEEEGDFGGDDGVEIAFAAEAGAVHGAEAPAGAAFEVFDEGAVGEVVFSVGTVVEFGVVGVLFDHDGEFGGVEGGETEGEEEGAEEMFHGWNPGLGFNRVVF